MTTTATLTELNSLFGSSPQKEAYTTTLQTLPKLLDADPDALRSELGIELLAKVEQESQSDGLAADVVEMVLSRKAANISVRRLLRIWTRDADQTARIVERAIALGEDPNSKDGDKLFPLTCVTDLGATTPCLSILAAKATDDVRFEAARAGLSSIQAAALANTQIVLDSLHDVHFFGPNGASVLHEVALQGPTSMLESLLNRGGNIDIALRAPYQFSCTACCPATGGFIPMLTFPAGLSILDLVESVLGTYRNRHKVHGTKGDFAKERERRMANLESNLALLQAKGARYGQPQRSDVPPWAAEVESILAAIARAAGSDADKVLRTARRVATTGIGPWTYATTTIEAADDIFGKTTFDARASWLPAIFMGERHQVKLPKFKALPPEGKKIMKAPFPLGKRDDRHLVMWLPKPGQVQFVEMQENVVEVLANDPVEFLRREARALNIDLEQVARTEPNQIRGPATVSPPFAPRFLKADYKSPPSATTINRLGGLPLGITEKTWPRFQGKPMHHLLTIDLHEHPALKMDQRALALFISSPGNHSAFEAGNEHVAVVLLSKQDLEAGEGTLPSDFEGSPLKAGTFIFADTAKASRKQLLAKSHAWMVPTWLQDGRSEEIRDRKPGDFVLQFDPTLIPGVNLGDNGIMYVFTKTAFFQCL